MRIGYSTGEMTRKTYGLATYQPILQVARDGGWRVAVLLSDGRISATDPHKYADQATAARAAIAAHHAKPFMNYLAVKGSRQ